MIVWCVRAWVHAHVPLCVRACVNVQFCLLCFWIRFCVCPWIKCPHTISSDQFRMHVLPIHLSICLSVCLSTVYKHCCICVYEWMHACTCANACMHVRVYECMCACTCCWRARGQVLHLVLESQIAEQTNPFINSSRCIRSIEAQVNGNGGDSSKRGKNTHTARGP